jgi:hypothetical protein
MKRAQAIASSRGKEPVVSIAAHQRTYQFSQNGAPSSTLLVELSGAHDDLLREMENVGAVTSGPAPDSAQVAAARWRLSKASLRRRSLSARIMEFLDARVDTDDLPHLAAFKAADQMMMRRSAEHVHQWTMHGIGEDWKGYCAASRDIRALVKAHVELEQRSIYPILERLSARAK